MRLFALAILALLSTPTLACDLSTDECWAQITPAPKPQVRAYVHRAPARVIVRRDVVSRPETIDHVDHGCVAPVAEVGDQHISEDGAKREADKSWAQTVRFRFGERMMDLTHARNVHYACGRSSIGSIIGQTFHRCEVYARPCQAPRIRVEK